MQLGRPRLPGETISAYELRESFDQLVDSAEFIVMAKMEREVARIAVAVDHLEAMKPRRVVDAGCSSGLFLGFLANFFSGMRFVGNDISPKSIALAKERLARLRVTNAEAIVCDHAELDAHVAEPVDVVILKDVFYGSELLPARHTYDDPEEWTKIFATDRVIAKRRGMLRGLTSRMRVGGTLLIIQPAGRGDHDAYQAVCAELGLTEVPSARRIIPGGATPAFTDIMLFRKSS